MTRGLAYYIIFADGKHSSLYEVFENYFNLKSATIIQYTIKGRFMSR